MPALAFSQVEMTNNQSLDKRSVAEFVYMLFNHPILYISLGGIEIDANLGDRLTAEGEALAIVLQIDLLHRRLGVLVQFKFDNVEVGLGEQNNIYSAIWRMYFHVHQIICQEREYDEEHLLIMTFIIGYVTIRNSTQKILQEMQGSIHILLVQSLGKATSCCCGGKCIVSNIRWDESLGQTYFHLLVGYVKGIIVVVLVVILDGDVAALVEQWHDGIHILRWCIKFTLVSFNATDVSRKRI